MVWVGHDRVGRGAETAGRSSGSAFSRRAVKAMVLTAVVIGVISAAAIVGYGVRSKAPDVARPAATENLRATPHTYADTKGPGEGRSSRRIATVG
jgi:multisubunit Na+/H+ antiporter MnhC subunit